MIYTVEFLLRARKEVINAWAWYEDKQPGLGDRFINELDKVTLAITKTPDRYPERVTEIREAKMKIFPYLIIYKINAQKKIIIVGSVFHTSRNPKRKYNG